MRIAFCFLLASMASFSYASIYSASVQTGGDYLVYGPACRLKNKIPQRTRTQQNIEMELLSDGKTLNILSRQLASGNCSASAAADMPRELHLIEGEVQTIPLQAQGASAIAGTKNTTFYVRWDRTAQGSTRVYGGCSWEYNCGGSGNSDVVITIAP